MGCIYLFKLVSSFFLDIYRRSGIVRSYDSSVVSFFRNLHTISIGDAPVYIPRNIVQGFSFPHILVNISYLYTFWRWPFWQVWEDTSLWFWFAFPNNKNIGNHSLRARYPGLWSQVVLRKHRYKQASGGDGIPVELLQILKDGAVKVLHSICHQIWKAQQWPQDWKISVFIPITKKAIAKECSNYRTNALISHNF